MPANFIAIDSINHYMYKYVKIYEYQGPLLPQNSDQAFEPESHDTSLLHVW